MLLSARFINFHITSPIVYAEEPGANGCANALQPLRSGGPRGEEIARICHRPEQPRCNPYHANLPGALHVAGPAISPVCGLPPPQAATAGPTTTHALAPARALTGAASRAARAAAPLPAAAAARQLRQARRTLCAAAATAEAETFQYQAEVGGGWGGLVGLDAVLQVAAAVQAGREE